MTTRPVRLAGWLVVAGAAVGWPAVAHACSATTNIALGSGQGPSGSTVSVRGAAFAGGPVQIHWGSVTGPLLATPVGATFSVRVTIPDVAPGLYYIDASDGVGPVDHVSAVFTVTARPSPVGGAPTSVPGSAAAPGGQVATLPAASQSGPQPVLLNSAPSGRHVSGSVAVGGATAAGSSAPAAQATATGAPPVGAPLTAAPGSASSAAPASAASSRDWWLVAGNVAAGYAPGDAAPAPREPAATGASGASPGPPALAAVLAATLLAAGAAGVAAQRRRTPATARLRR